MENTAAGAATGSMISPGWGTVIGAGIGLVGDLIGGNSSSHESQANRREARRQFNLQREDNLNATQIRVADALKAGINPLAALGVSQNVSPTVHAGGDSDVGSYASRAGDRLQRMIEKLTADKAVDDANYDSQAKELDLEGKRLENRILQARLASLTPNSPGNPDNIVSSPRVLDGEVMVFRPAYDLQGRPRLVINQDVLEGDADNPGYLASIGQLYVDGHINQLTGKLDRDAAEKVRWMYYNSTGRDLWNWEEMYISPSEAAAAASMFVRGGN